ncbi:rod shape-determining protein MreD [Mobilisporobacter senegalensis]|uniref:Rod shape-determining protein MreD n=1 Tax=Mobilisporobacter senegalensis TaxID=1329262 RepID=A0A3N1XSM8_9FIRM|nr:rod shape-determining protein MreD [Mobilisporobacter senegalensis]ROR29141.1 rod shape-determining protein MreD [Mobilisporobacter senegalensis]
MKRFGIMLIIIILCFLLQSTFFQALALADVVPNLLLIITVAVGYMRGRKEGLVIGLICGLLSDFVYSDVIGVCALIYMVIGYLNGIFNMLFFRDVLTIPILLIGVSDLVYNFMYYVMEFLLRSRLNLFFYFRRIMIPELVYTVLVSVLLYKLLHNLNAFLERRENKEV